MILDLIRKKISPLWTITLIYFIVAIIIMGCVGGLYISYSSDKNKNKDKKKLKNVKYLSMLCCCGMAIYNTVVILIVLCVDVAGEGEHGSMSGNLVLTKVVIGLGVITWIIQIVDLAIHSMPLTISWMTCHTAQGLLFYVLHYFSDDIRQKLVNQYQQTAEQYDSDTDIDIVI